MRSRVEIEFILLQTVQSTTAAQKAAYENLKAITSEIPSGLPSPDGTARIKQAGERNRAALNALNNALQRWHDFTVHGTIPEDLKD